jgi:hypothetical protein
VGNIVFENNAMPATSGFEGSGVVTVQSGDASYLANVSIPYTFASTISGFTFGKSSNDVNVAIDAPIEINGPVTIYGKNLNINADISAALLNAALAFKAKGNLVLAAGKSLTSNAGVITLNSDADASGAGHIILNAGSAVTSNDGAITLGGCLNPLTGYAVGSAAGDVGISIYRATISSGAGNIVLNGQGNGDYGIYLEGNLTSNASAGFASIESTTGSITLNASRATGTALLLYRPNTQVVSSSGNISVNTIGGFEMWRDNAWEGAAPVMTTGGAGTIDVDVTGNITINSANLITEDGDITVAASGNLSQIWGAYFLTSGSGDIDIDTTGFASLGGTTGVHGGLRTSGTGSISVAASTIKLAGHLIARGDITLSNNVALEIVSFL